MRVKFLSYCFIIAMFISMANLSNSASNSIEDSDAPILEKVNETYFVNGEEAFDVETLSPSSKNLNNPKILIVNPTSNNWNMMSKNLINETMCHHNFAYTNDNLSQDQQLMQLYNIQDHIVQIY